MRKIGVFLGLVTFSAVVSQATPTQQQVEKWGVYATMADVGWWHGPGGKAERYSWSVPNERMLLEIFEADGTLAMTRTFRIDGKTFINEGLATAPIVSAGPNHIRFSTDNVIEIDEDGDDLEHRFVHNGKEQTHYYSRIPAPIFPDAALIVRMKGKQMCPPTKAALAQMLLSVGSKDTQTEQPVVTTGSGFFIGGYAGERSYAAAAFRLLEVKPNSVKAGIIGGKPSDLDAMLPGYDARRYEPAFRAAYPKGRVYCNGYGCRWTPREDTWNAPAGTLTQASTAQTIMSKTETRFSCQYR